MYTFSFESQFNFNDLVDFESSHASGRGRVMDIVLGFDQKVYYIILRDDGDSFGGIFAHEMRLVKPSFDSDDPPCLTK